MKCSYPSLLPTILTDGIAGLAPRFLRYRK